MDTQSVKRAVAALEKAQMNLSTAQGYLAQAGHEESESEFNQVAQIKAAIFALIAALGSHLRDHFHMLTAR